MQLDHVTVRTRNLAAAKAFFLNLFELEEKPRPKAIQHIPGHWLFRDDRPLVHLVAAAGYGYDSSAEAIDHVGIRLDNYQSMRARLDHLGIPYSLMDLAEIEERRIFFRVPGGVLLEAVFSEVVPPKRLEQAPKGTTRK